MNLPGTVFKPWNITGETSEIVDNGLIEMDSLDISPHYVPPDEVLKRVPMKLLGQHADLLGYAKMPSPLAVDDRRGAVLL